MSKDMEKLTKKELMEKLGGVLLSDEELEKVSGGTDCYDKCDRTYSGVSLEQCYSSCARK